MALPAPTPAPSAAGAALTWELTDGIAVVTFDLKGESVNKISRAVKQDVLATFEALERDAAVQAVAFFSGKAENFIAGADIEEFVTLSSAAEAERLSADGQDLLERVARLPKPVAVGIHGAWLGGGLEFALACRYRVASDHPKTQLGLPEVQLGILPGAGGCQRLPRLIGTRAALDMILAGKVERAQKAFRIGIVDELVHPAILKDVTLAAARRMAGGWRPKRKRRGGLAGWVLDGNPLGRRLVFRAARKQVQEKTAATIPRPWPRWRRSSTASSTASRRDSSTRRSCSGSSPSPTCPASWSRSSSPPPRSRRTSGWRRRRRPRPSTCGGWASWGPGSWEQGSRAPRSRKPAWTCA